MAKYSLVVLFLLASHLIFAQSLELMAGNKHIFTDAQWLKFMDNNRRTSIFSRTRATVDYDNKTNLFTGAYFNFTLPNGLGASAVGKIANASSGVDVGIHFFKANKKWMLFGLAAVGLKKELEYSWFSICRYTPYINEKWGFYSSLELFTLFGKTGHFLSVQRLRLGLDYSSFQFGLAGNFSGMGDRWASGSNLGLFARRSF